MIEGMGDEEDALMVFYDEHRGDAGHKFSGEPIVSTYDDKKPVKAKNVPYRRRR
jgi:hypothetical protein